MDFIKATATNNLALQKAISLLAAILFSLSAVIELCQVITTPVAVDEQLAGLQAKMTYYGPLWGELTVGLAAAMLFWWLHRRVRCVTASELGLQILSEPVKAVTWPEVCSVKKALPNLLNGLYLVTLADGTEFYTPIEREPPRFSTLITWYEAPTSLEQLCIKKGVWVL